MLYLFEQLVIVVDGNDKTFDIVEGNIKLQTLHPGSIICESSSLVFRRRHIVLWRLVTIIKIFDHKL